MLNLQGEKQITTVPQALWSKLTDLTFLTQCVPDVSQVKEITETSAALTLRPGFSFVRGEMELTIEKLEEQPPCMARLLMKTKGIGSSSEVEAAFNLEDQDSGSLVRWSAEVKQLGGLLKAVPKGLIQGAAQKVITDLLANVEAKLQ